MYIFCSSIFKVVSANVSIMK